MTTLSQIGMFRGSALLLLCGSLAGCGVPGAPGPDPVPATPVTTLADSGPGSLREVLAAAKDGDLVRIMADGVLQLQSPIDLSGSVTIETPAGAGTTVTLDIAGKDRVLYVEKGATATLRGLTLANGVSNDGGAGGVVYVKTGGVLTLENTVVTGGKAKYGGGIFVEKDARLTLKGGSVDHNAATGSGGGVQGNGSLTLDGVVIQHNTAGTNGGGLETYQGQVSFLSGTVTDNTALRGGGLSVNGGTLTMAEGSVTGNTATGPSQAGGGVQVFANSTFTLNGGTISANRCTFPRTTDGSTQTGCGGGGVASSGTVLMTGGTVAKNTATWFGAGVASYDDPRTPGALTLQGGVIEGNAFAPLPTSSGDVYTFGGGVAVGSIFLMQGGTVRNNDSSQGYAGGLGLENDAQGVIKDGVVEGNVAAAGGGLFVLGSGKTLSGGTIQANRAVGRAASGPLGQLFADGGGVLVSTGSLTISGGSIANNTAASSGGGLKVYSSGNVTFSGGAVRNNTALSGGGVALNAPNNNAGAQLVLTGGTVSGNVASNGNGGGIENSGTLSLRSGGVTGNRASGQGGGVFNAKAAHFEQTGGTVSGNQPTDIAPQP
jgi:hypothetical protein